jgi:predicted amidohydrolase
VRISAIQFDVKFGDTGANRSAVRRLVEAASTTDPPPDVIVLPEMWNTGYSLHNVRDICDRDGEPTKSLISGLCRRFRVNILAGSVADMRDGRCSTRAMCSTVPARNSRGTARRTGFALWASTNASNRAAARPYSK